MIILLFATAPLRSVKQLLPFIHLLRNPLGLLDVSGEGVCHRTLIIDRFHCPDIGQDNANIV